MYSKALTAIAAGAIALMSASAAHAGITFTFQNPGADLPTEGNFTTGGLCNGIGISGTDLCTIDNAAGLTYRISGVELNATALSGDTPSALVQDLQPNNSGLAVLTAGEGSSDDQVQVGRNESILFDFMEEVTVTEIDFNAGNDVNCADFLPAEGPCGNFTLLVDGIATLVDIEAVDNFFTGGIVGTTFQIIATGPVGTGFTIGSITIADVPLPAGAWLLITGLAGLGFAGRQKKAL